MKDKGFSVCYSAKHDAKEAFRDVVSQMESTSPLLILFFSDIENFPFYSQELYKAFPKAEIVGTTTYVVLSSLGHDKSALTVLAVYEGVECAGGVIEDVTRYPAKHKNVIIDSIARLSGFDHCCCFEVTTAFGSCEEIVQDTFKSVLEEIGIPVFGGSAGNDSNSTESYVSYNGVLYREACAYVLIRNLHGRIRIFRENLYRPTNKVFYATDVDCEERKVYEFDDKPAAKVLAKALGVKQEELPSLLPKHPLGRMTDGEIYITEHNGMTEDGALTYFARIYNHTKVTLLTADEPEKVWENTIERIHEDINDFRFMIIVNCLSRSKLFEQSNQLDAFSEILHNELGEYVGFSGYGEQMNYEHLNQTMLVAVFE